MAVAYTTKSYVIGKTVLVTEETLERHADVGEIVGVGEISSTDWHQVRDAATVKGIGVVSATEEFERPLESTVVGVGVLSHVESYHTEDQETVIGVGEISATEERGTTDELGTVIGVGQIDTTESTDYIDSGTIVGVGALSHTIEYTDESIVISRGHVTERDDDADYVDDGAVIGISQLVTDDRFGGRSAETVIGVGEVESEDVAVFDDVSTVTGIGIIAQVTDDIGEVIGVGEILTDEAFSYGGQYDIVGVGEIDTIEDYVKTIEESTVIGVGVIEFEEGTIGNNVETVIQTNYIEAAEEYNANRGTSVQGIAPMVGSGVAQRTYTRAGTGTANMTASGGKSAAQFGTVPGYVNGGNITAITTATPMVVTLANHAFISGQSIYIEGVTGMTDANDLWEVGDTTTDTFELLNPDGSDAGTAQTYTSGGHAQNGYGGIHVISAATAASPISVTDTGHGYNTGDVVKIVGGTGLAGINGIWEITVTDVNTYTLNGSTGSGTYNANTARVAKPTGALYTTTATQFPQLPNYQKYNA